MIMILIVAYCQTHHLPLYYLVSDIIIGNGSDGESILLTSSRDGTVVRTSTSSGNTQTTLLKESTGIHSLDFDPDSKLFSATSSVGGLWVNTVI